MKVKTLVHRFFWGLVLVGTVLGCVLVGLSWYATGSVGVGDTAFSLLLMIAPYVFARAVDEVLKDT